MYFFFYFCRKKESMNYQRLADNDILIGLKQGNERVFRDYFYSFCLMGYRLFDKRYGLSTKQNLDFMSMAHQYALYLIEHDWKPLEACPPEVSLRSWLINGFRFVVLDALKWYKREYGSISFEDYIRSFDTSSDIKKQFRRAVKEMCDHSSLNSNERIVVDMLMQGYKVKEVADALSMTPSAVSQKYKHLKEKVIVPYFQQNYDIELEAPVMMEEIRMREVEECRQLPSMSVQHEMFMDSESMVYDQEPMVYDQEPMVYDQEPMVYDCESMFDSNNMEQKRTTPEVITDLQPNEIFVFGSNLKGLHGGGAAYMAYRKFGAVMGQGIGLQGQSYAIPTMQGGVETIRPHVDEFIAFARQHPELTFLVTRIGCGIAGFTDEEIAPLFLQAHDVDNIVLPRGW